MFNKSYKSWSSEDDILLNKLYNIEQLNIMEIYNKCERSPGSVLSRLKKHGWITNIYDARGYKDYIKSNLYKSLKNNKKKQELNNKTYNISDLQHDLIEIKNEIYNLKNMILNINNESNNEEAIKKDIVEKTNNEIQYNIKEIIFGTVLC
jgi:hypothetical protein